MALVAFLRPYIHSHVAVQADLVQCHFGFLHLHLDYLFLMAMPAGFNVVALGTFQAVVLCVHFMVENDLCAFIVPGLENVDLRRLLDIIAQARIRFYQNYVDSLYQHSNQDYRFP